ncbi:TIGR04141 family sporadically distributed protein [Amycolatopsis sp. NBC_01488]|uniref:TIGR04141 family sporadically distributed protein n=1 Tax=Amycolatopsis sp. NBC_01488 TaxID=2903563 RepID=UPI002E281104|nr:TIGR04141 family sporadically distributed protein [Amycolatopsis sp. NBC_01488]
MASTSTPSKPVSLFRLDGTAAEQELLVPLKDDQIVTDTEVDLSGTRARLVAGRFRTEAPQWLPHAASLTGTELALSSELPFAVLLVPRPPWTYAVTWGAGHLILNDEHVDQGFGLLFGIRRLDPFDLGLVASAALDTSARATQTSIPGGGDLSAFRLEPYGELVNRLAGTADLADLTYGRITGRRHRIRAGNAVWLPLAKDPAAFLADLDAVGAVVDEPDAHSALRFVAQTRPLDRHDSLLPTLERRLAESVDGENGALGLAWPATAVHDAEQAGSFRITGLGPGGPFTVPGRLELAHLTDRLAGIDVDDRLKAVRAGRIVPCADDAGEEEAGASIPVARWLVFETTIDHVRYVFHQGRWYRIGETYVRQLREQVAAMLARRFDWPPVPWVPTGTPDDEHAYCRQVAEEPGFLCLDRDFASTPLHPRFELCDLLGPGDELIHVKWLSRATAASHLCTQALVSAEALAHEPEALAQLAAKAAPDRVIDRIPRTVVLAAAGRSWNIDELFTLSQVSLLRLDRSVRALQATLRFADVPYVPKARTHATSARRRRS